MAKKIVQNSLTEALGLDLYNQYGDVTSQLVNPLGIGYNISYGLLTLLPYPLSYAYKQYGFLTPDPLI